MTWTKFWDMHSGGTAKQPPYEYIFIEAPEREALAIFIERFGHDPREVGCACCGENYAVDAYATLEQATGFHRNCASQGGDYIEAPRQEAYYAARYTPFADAMARGYLDHEDDRFLVIRAEELAR